MKSKNELSFTKIFKEKTGKEFDTYYKKYYPKLTWTIKNLNINDIDAESIANEAFIRSLEKIEQYKPEYQYSTWLFNIGKNIAYKFKKDEAKTICVDISKSNVDDNVASFQYFLNTKIDETNTNISYEDVHSIKYEETLKEISDLSPKYKDIIEMCDIYGLTYNQIVDETGESLQTIKNRLHHGRKKIKNKLKNKFEYVVNSY